MHPQGDDIATSTVTLAPTAAKADLMASGRLFRVRFSGESAPTGVRLGKPTFDATPAGLA
jgi:hypothetical protein